MVPNLERFFTVLGTDEYVLVLVDLLIHIIIPIKGESGRSCSGSCSWMIFTVFP